MPASTPPPDPYTEAGVDIAAAQAATRLMAAAVRATYGPEVLAGLGAFGGLFDGAALKAMDQPVLVASTDGVGTKTKIAARLGRWDTIGHDLVNHCVNDILVQGARPLFFLDYVATARLEPAQIATVVTGVAAACRAAGCALLGGETAEMPGVYRPGEIDLVGTIIGVVERAAIVDGRAIQPGDQVLGLPSSGLHTNGYSLARRVLADLDWSRPLPDSNHSLGDALLAPHRSYQAPVTAWQQAGLPIHGLAHITGGGIVDNLPRILPPGSAAIIRRDAWTIPALFQLIQAAGTISDEAMFHTFNMGLGLLAVMPPEAVSPARVLTPEALVVGEIVDGDPSVNLVKVSSP